MVLKLYMIETSPPVRSVLLTAEFLGVELECIRYDLFKGEHMTSEFVKLNPQHTVPTLDDDGKIIWDSHAINIYLVEKYALDDSLYPKDPYQRALINQRLFFDSGVVFATAAQIIQAIGHGDSKTVPPEKAAALIEAYELLEKFLDGRKWTTGDEVTLADYSLIPSITSTDVMVPVDKNKFPKITAWIKRAKYWPYYHINQHGLDMFREFISSKLQA